MKPYETFSFADESYRVILRTIEMCIILAMVEFIYHCRFDKTFKIRFLQRDSSLVVEENAWNVSATRLCRSRLDGRKIEKLSDG